jgi:quinol monooxygenase YgiN
MFTRVVELKAKPGKAKELAKTIHDKAVPVLRELQGFVDEIVLVSDTEPDQIVALSFWKRQQDGERYNREHYPKVAEIISHLVESAPVVRTFNVDSSTTHKIAAGKAAA